MATNFLCGYGGDCSWGGEQVLSLPHQEIFGRFIHRSYRWLAAPQRMPPALMKYESRWTPEPRGLDPILPERQLTPPKTLRIDFTDVERGAATVFGQMIDQRRLVEEPLLPPIVRGGHDTHFTARVGIGRIVRLGQCYGLHALVLHSKPLDSRFPHPAIPRRCQDLPIHGHLGKQPVAGKVPFDIRLGDSAVTVVIPVHQVLRVSFNGLPAKNRNRTLGDGANELHTARLKTPPSDQACHVKRALGMCPDQKLRRIDLRMMGCEGANVFNVVHLCLNANCPPHLGVDTGGQVMLGHFQFTAASLARWHVHLVAPNAAVVIPHHRHANRREALRQIPINEVPPAARPAHVAIAVHEPTARHHAYDRVRCVDIGAGQVNLPGKPNATGGALGLAGVVLVGTSLLFPSKLHVTVYSDRVAMASTYSQTGGKEAVIPFADLSSVELRDERNVVGKLKTYLVFTGKNGDVIKQLAGNNERQAIDTIRQALADYQAQPPVAAVDKTDLAINVSPPWNSAVAGTPSVSRIRSEMKRPLRMSSPTAPPTSSPQQYSLKRYAINIPVPADHATVGPDTVVTVGTKLGACFAGSWSTVTVVAINEDGTITCNWDSWPSYTYRMMPLQIGMKLGACYAGRWEPVTVLAINQDGTITCNWDKWPSFTYKMMREDLTVANRNARQF